MLDNYRDAFTGYSTEGEKKAESGLILYRPASPRIHVLFSGVITHLVKSPDLIGPLRSFTAHYRTQFLTRPHHSNVIQPLPGPPNGLFLCNFQTKILYAFHILHVRYMRHPSHPHCFKEPCISPFACYVPSLTCKYSLQQFILEQPYL